MTFAPLDGTRYALPPTYAAKRALQQTLQTLYSSWGFAQVDLPALEPYLPTHPAAHKSFKLIDHASAVLALRADFTPALANMVRLHYEKELLSGVPLRFQYADKLWQTVTPDAVRTREYTQVGVELIGVSNARADAELIHLARESLRVVGLEPRVEVGNPGFVRALFHQARIPEDQQDVLADAITRKDTTSLAAALPQTLEPRSKQALLRIADLYGDVSILNEVDDLAIGHEAKQQLTRLKQVISELEDTCDILIDLGMARRHRYYTGVTFRAYTFDFGQPLLGGGRYDHSLLPHAAGFAIGLDRILSALPEASIVPDGVDVLSFNDPGARALRRAGYTVERALSTQLRELRHYALAKHIPYILTASELLPLGATNPLVTDKMQRVLSPYLSANNKSAQPFTNEVHP